MPDSKKRRSDKVGLPPGTLVHLGEEQTASVQLLLTHYDSTQLEEIQTQDPALCLPLPDQPMVTWILIDGIHKTDLVTYLGNHFGIHPLVQEDIVNPNQRPKFEIFDHMLYVVVRSLHFDPFHHTVGNEQISLLLGPQFVITFLEKSGGLFNPIRERLRKEASLIRTHGADYLLYALLDTVVDNYFVVLDRLEDQMDLIEEEVTDNPSEETLPRINFLKNEMIHIRRSVRPLREVVVRLIKLDSELISDEIKVYLEDIHDHLNTIIDTIESFREVLAGKVDIYLSSLSNRMNKIVHTLTIISTIFIPLTFIAGIYGMNFSHMPELAWEWGYPFSLSIMLAVAAILLAVFRRRRWL